MLANYRPYQMRQGLLALWLMLLGVLITDASAQTEFQISSTNPQLAEQYKAELDNWLLKAFEGDADAQFKVGVLYTNDQFRAPDFEQAAYWYSQAAEQGHTLAQYNLGHQYLLGQGVQENPRLAMRWWLKSAEQDHALSQFNVGRAYYLGIGLEKNERQARKWFERAAKNGEPKSAEILVQLGWDTPQSAGESKDKEVFQSKITPVAKPEDTQRSVASSPSTAQAPTQNRNKSNSNTKATSSVHQIKTSETGLETDSRSGSKSRFSVLDDDPRSAVVAPVKPQSTSKSARSTPVEQVATQPISNENSRTVQNVTRETTDQARSVSNVALFSNPETRSVLIALESDPTQLTPIKKQGDWTSVSHQNGFPVWVHGDFLSVDGEVGTISARRVNARAVPVVAPDTLLERFKKNESVEVIGSQDEWFRVRSPARFKAWVKTAELAALETHVLEQERIIEQKIKAEEARVPIGTPDLDWLFAQPSGNLTLQLAGFKQPIVTETFVASINLSPSKDLRRIELVRDGQPWTYFVYGSYATRAEANSAKSAINQDKAWMRSLNKIKESSCQAWQTSVPVAPEYNHYCTR